MKDWNEACIAGVDIFKMANNAAASNQAGANGASQNSQFAASQREAPWPVLNEAALHGLAGEVVKTIEPHTEGDPVAVLLQFLACAGNMMGRSHWYRIEGTRHYPNIFVVLTGNSAKARKGTSYGRVISVARVADECWVSHRTKGGMSSGVS